MNLSVSTKRAYRDLCRTIEGFSKNLNHDVILNNALESLNKEINVLINQKIKN